MSSRMRAPRRAARRVAGWLGVNSLILSGCSAQPEVPDEGQVDPEVAAMVNAENDHSRCDYQGRTDRLVQESSGPGAQHHNVRRVYRLVGDGADQRRVIVCREIDTNLDGLKDLVRRYDDKGEVAEELADSNYDGRIDTWISYTRGRIAKLELDSNGDERPDETRLYVNGTLSRVQRDTNGDGKPDVWEIYSEQRLERMGMDLNYDGRVDRWDRDEVAMRAAEEKRREEEERAGQRKSPSGGGASAEDPASQDGAEGLKDGQRVR